MFCLWKVFRVACVTHHTSNIYYSPLLFLGQNKNNTVLRLAAMLSECGYFYKVNCIFYIVGHTKNACDRWFNTLKRLYRTSDIWTMGMLMKQLETNERITISSISVGDFKYYGRFLSLYYYAIAGGKCLSGHIFTCQRDSTTMCINSWGA